ncbi:hypothetical protein [Cupriavidus sp. TMH.W2]|uniref:hypothetical protein n=1 Tax=Cupriavidus sp. TMH.W2 TaxID=3434465 RepID=UPI003D77F1B7
MTATLPYPKGDLRRLLSVLGAIDRPQGARLFEIVQATGLDKRTVSLLIEQAGAQAGVQITRSDRSYRVSDWGPILRQTGVQLALTGEIVPRQLGEQTL